MIYKTPLRIKGFVPCDWNEGNPPIAPHEIKIEKPGEYLRDLKKIDNDIISKFKLKGYDLKLFPGSDISIFTVFSFLSKKHNKIYLIREDYKQAAFFAEIFFNEIEYIDDFEQEAPKIPKNSLIYFSNPGNPNCKYFNSKLLSDLIPKHLNCIIDLAYIDFYEDFSFQDFNHLPQIFFIKTFSKFYGLSGLRTGLLIFKSDDKNLKVNLAAVNSKWIGAGQVASIKIVLQSNDNKIRLKFKENLKRLQIFLEENYGNSCKILCAGNFFRLDFSDIKYKNQFISNMAALEISIRDLGHIESLKKSVRINYRDELIEYLHI